MSFYRGFNDDPFFNRSFHHPQFMMDPFHHQRQHHHRTDRRPPGGHELMLHDPFMMSPFGGFDPFARMQSMMANFERDMHQLSNSANGGHSYSQSTVMQYSSIQGGDGKPQIYQASSSVTSAPGGITESRKMEKDSRTGIEKMSVGHQIGDRSHTIERKVNVKTNEREENHDLQNLTENEATDFNKEWETRTRSYHRQPNSLNGGRRYAEARGLPSIDSHRTHPYRSDGGVSLDGEGRAKKKKHKVII